MKLLAVVFLATLCYVQCKKIAPPLDKNANLAFINMESGGGVRPGDKPSQPAPVKPPSPTSAATPTKPPSPTPAPTATKLPPKEHMPTPKPTISPQKPAASMPYPVPNKPASPTQFKPVPVNPSPVANPITTPGPGSVKQLINFYDSQGKASPIRPYSYSQAVKQG